MKTVRLLLLAALSSVILAGCSAESARISGTIQDAPGKEIILRRLNINTYDVIDTLTTASGGSFSCRLDVKKGQPQFIYLFYGDTRIASLLVEAGDRISVEADTLGKYTVEGSEESLRLQGVEDRLKVFASDLSAAVKEGDGQKISKLYIDYYRDCVRYVVENPFSLTSIPVLYQYAAENLPVFSQATDAIHFRSVCDSLKTVYPESRYVKALEKETVRREQMLNLNSVLSGAEEVGYPELNMPDVNGKKVALSSVDAKAVMVHFWSAADAGQKMFNLDVLKPLYEEYHPRGLEIYAVCVDADKAGWASAVKNQNLPWINVNDGLGASSSGVLLYNVTSLPTTVLISGGELFPGGKISGAKDLRAALEKILK